MDDASLRVLDSARSDMGRKPDQHTTLDEPGDNSKRFAGNLQESEKNKSSSIVIDVRHGLSNLTARLKELMSNHQEEAV